MIDMSNVMHRGEPGSAFEGLARDMADGHGKMYGYCGSRVLVEVKAHHTPVGDIWYAILELQPRPSASGGYSTVLLDAYTRPEDAIKRIENESHPGYPYRSYIGERLAPRPRASDEPLPDAYGDW